MEKFVSQGSYIHTARPKMQEEREARLRVEAELCQTKQRLARGGTAPSFHNANTELNSESERISRLETQLAIFIGIQGAEASIFSHQNHSAASKPSSSAGSSPKVVKDGEDKDVDDEINQTKRNIEIGKGKSFIMFLETSGSSIAVTKGNDFRSKSSDMLHNVRI
ncbi:hypothetical protein MKX03_012447, partial [Papaver bracteatum]